MERRCYLPQKVTKINALKVLQWNCDGIATKRDELEEFLEDRKVRVALILDSKLGAQDATPKIRGYTAYRKDRERSGTTGPRAGGRGGGSASSSETGCRTGKEPVPSQGILERQKIVIHREGCNLELTNLYIPPTRGPGAAEE